MRKTPTPTKTFPGGNAHASASTSAIQNPGPSKKGIGTYGSQRKARCDDDVIPSDESDAGTHSPFGKPRTRIRKRRGTRATSVSASAAVSWMSFKPEHRSDIRSPSTKVSTISEKRRSPTAKTLFPPVPSKRNNTKSTCSSTAAKVSGRRLTAQRKQTEPPASGTDKAVHGGSPKALGLSPPPNCSERVMCPNANPNGTNESSFEFVFYTVWCPAWDIIWKCDNGKVPLTQNKDFCTFINKVLIENVGPELDCAYDITVIRVNQLKEASTSDNYQVIGMLEANPPKARKKLKWQPSPRILKQLLKVVVTTSDIIVQCIPKTTSPSNNVRTICFVHLTSQDGDKADFCRLFEGLDVNLVIYNIKYEHYRPKIVKCFPSRQTPMKSSENIQPNFQVGQAPAHSSTSASRIARTPQSKSTDLQAGRLESPEPANSYLNPSRAGSASGDLVTVGKNGADKVFKEKSQLSTLNEKDKRQPGDIIELSEGESDQNEIVGESVRVNFDLRQFMKTGVFLPGPLRPKIRKQERNCYEYTKLQQLDTMLKKAIDDDVSKDVVPSMMIKHECNVYGIVDEVVTQFRHENAYFVRISDETMDFVLLRIHMGGNNPITGPKINVGNIIRVHRVKVQCEWDAGLCENSTVLSTPSHLNYVLFEESNTDNQFYYNSCAQKITLDDFDLKRVGELYKFKLQRLAIQDKLIEEASITEQNNVVDEENLNGQQDSPSTVPESDALHRNPDASRQDKTANSQFGDGVCDSDLESPPLTSEPEGMTPANSENMRLSVNDSNNQLRSDESFVSASSEVTHPNEDRNSDNSNDNGEPISNEMQLAVTNSQDLVFTLFRDLNKDNRTHFNLLCQIISICETTEQTFVLIVRDFEQTVPPDDFVNLDFPPLEPGQSNECYLAINVTNASCWENRNVFSLLYNGIGTDEFYSIQNARVKGTERPFQVEVDGKTSAVARYPYYIQDLLIDDSFNAKTLSEGTCNNDRSRLPSNSSDVGVGNEDHSDSEAPAAHSSLQQRQPDIDDASSQSSSYSTAEQSPNPSPIKHSPLNRAHDDPVVTDEQWTSRLRTRR